MSESNLPNSKASPTRIASASLISPCKVQRFRGMAPRKRRSKGIFSEAARKDKSTNKILASSERISLNPGTSDTATRAELFQGVGPYGHVPNHVIQSTTEITTIRPLVR